MENNRENASAQTETEFEPISLVCDILKNWWVILFGALAGAMLFYVASSMIYVPNYRTQATFVITSRANANAYNNLSSANSMAETFQKILESTIMKKTICEKLDMDKLDADISANVVNGTNILTLSVTAHSPKDSIDIIKTVMDNYTSISYYTVGTTVLDVLEDPKIPYAPVNPPQNGEMAKKGFFLGMAVCMLLFAIWSYMHNTVKQEREVEKKLDARSLGAISYEWKYKTIKEWIKHRKKSVLVDNPLASFRFVESFKMLAARVEYHMSKINGKILVVTSVCENEGKSSVAGNLAITLAKKGKRVILIDGDIRCPAQYLLLGMSPKKENELGEFLNGRTGANNILLNTERKRLGFIGGKVSYSASTEMLGNRQLPVLIEACSKIVDYVIIDTPPSGMIGDAQIFAQHADAVMVVARQNVTLAEDINEMMDDFRDNHTKVLGVVLNGVMTFQSIADSPVGDHYSRYSRYGRYGRYGKYTNNKEV